MIIQQLWQCLDTFVLTPLRTLDDDTYHSPSLNLGETDNNTAATRQELWLYYYGIFKGTR